MQLKLAVERDGQLAYRAQVGVVQESRWYLPSALSEIRLRSHAPGDLGAVGQLTGGREDLHATAVEHACAPAQAAVRVGDAQQRGDLRASAGVRKTRLAASRPAARGRRRAR